MVEPRLLRDFLLARLNVARIPLGRYPTRPDIGQSWLGAIEAEQGIVEHAHEVTVLAPGPCRSLVGIHLVLLARSFPSRPPSPRKERLGEGPQNSRPLGPLPRTRKEDRATIRPPRRRFFVDVYMVRPVGAGASCTRGHKSRALRPRVRFSPPGQSRHPDLFHRANYNTLIERLDSVGDC